MKESLPELKQKLLRYEERLAEKMKGYRGVIHESALSELRHSEVMVLRDIIRELKEEIFNLEHPVSLKNK